MSTDRELLELAAKAAGMQLLPEGRWPHGAKGWFYNNAGGDGGMYYNDEPIPKWNPLTDDGDALRLAASLFLDVTYGFAGCQVNVCAYDWAEERDRVDVCEDGRRDVLAATRRCIVRAAAEIGRAL